jgi:hypothetical protein
MNENASSRTKKSDHSQIPMMRAAAIAACARILNDIEIHHSALYFVNSYRTTDHIHDGAIRAEASERRAKSLSLE